MKTINIARQRIEVEQIIQWCIHARDNYVNILKKILLILKKKAVVSLNRSTECSETTIILNNQALCGLCKHTSSTESYFFETSYEYVKFDEPFIMNEKGQIINILPIVQKQNKEKKIEWQCGFSCKVNEVSIINRFKELLITVSNCSTIRNIPKLIKLIGICTVKQSNKLGHSQACYIDHKLCKSKLLASFSNY